jgi:hypothetical protein
MLSEWVIKEIDKIRSNFFMIWAQRLNSGKIYEPNSMTHDNQTETHWRVGGLGPHHNEPDTNDKKCMKFFN